MHAVLNGNVGYDSPKIQKKVESGRNWITRPAIPTDKNYTICTYQFGDYCLNFPFLTPSHDDIDEEKIFIYNTLVILSNIIYTNNQARNSKDYINEFKISIGTSKQDQTNGNYLVSEENAMGELNELLRIQAFWDAFGADSRFQKEVDRTLDPPTHTIVQPTVCSSLGIYLIKEVADYEPYSEIKYFITVLSPETQKRCFPD